MKFRSTLLLVMVLAAVLTTSSCVKVYTCRCVIKYSGAPGLPDSTVQEYDVQARKAGAEERCKGESGVFDNGNIHTEETCTLY